MALTDTAIPSTVTDVGRGVIMASGVNRPTIARVVFGAGRHANPAAATGVATPLATPVSLAPTAFRLDGDTFQATMQQGRTAAGYDTTEAAFLDDMDRCIIYTAAAQGSVLFSKGLQPSVWTLVGRLLNLPAGATIRFDVDVGYFIADGDTYGTVQLAGDVDVDADESAASGNRKVLTIEKLWRWVTGARIVARLSGISDVLAINQVTGLTDALAGKADASDIPNIDVSGFRRIITLRGAGNAFPTNPAPANGENWLFNEAVAAGLSWRDTNGVTLLTSAAKGDWAQYNGARWVKQVKRSGDLFTVPE